MKLSEYKKLVNVRFFRDGEPNNYYYFSGWCPEYSCKTKGINEGILKDLDGKYDFKNIIIFIPKQNWIMNPEIISSHCTHIVDLKIELHKLGITFKNGISLKSREYSQYPTGKLVIENGIAYNFPRDVNPTSKIGWDKAKEIDYDGEKIDLNNKPILLSGIANYLLSLKTN